MSNNKLCPCGSENEMDKCCLPFILEGNAPTAEKLMRSRYTAYTIGDAEYLYNTTHVSQRKYANKSDILAWSKQNTWVKLEIIHVAENTVEFKAFYFDQLGKPQEHHEKSTFIKFQEHWYYVDGKFY
ncbi:YchJ family protein [Flavobacterium urocaniciphilum]|uniref:SEC-C motif-containing protein n=1 Tax=Flavobacterium urocaniciphilum TaxID=1299341 RepID=A0A1H9CV10_9FLAO|nr:YchJ family metal-binding protein [Flavobacterium urocaniciphilum]SEQ04981.1 SEC-C motif-containing protein [Flavobacterium urocaniciphilum]